MLLRKGPSLANDGCCRNASPAVFVGANGFNGSNEDDTANYLHEKFSVKCSHFEPIHLIYILHVSLKSQFVANLVVVSIV